MSPPSSPGGEEASSVVEYCVHNVEGEPRERVTDAPVETRGAPCLERCGTCRTTTFLVVDGDLRVGESHATLLTELREVTR